MESSTVIQVEKVMILYHLHMHQDSFLSPLLTRELHSRIVFKDMNLKLRNERRELIQQEERMTDEETISLTTDAPVEYLL